MFPNKCKAILMTENNDILEYGEAKISLKNKTVDFTGNFVPLMTIGTPIKIVCCEGEQNTHLIQGSTYLSSEKLLRIDNISLKLLEDAEKVLTMEVAIPAKILEVTKKATFFSTKSVKQWIDCTISSISADRVCFHTSWKKTSASNISRIKIAQPVFPADTDIEVKISGKPVIFGEKYKYIYSMVDIDESEKKSLLTFIKQYSTLMVNQINSSQ